MNKNFLHTPKTLDDCIKKIEIEPKRVEEENLKSIE